MRLSIEALFDDAAAGYDRARRQLVPGLDGEWLKPSRLGAAQQQAWQQRWRAAIARARADGGPAVPERFEIQFRDGGADMHQQKFSYAHVVE